MNQEPNTNKMRNSHLLWNYKVQSSPVKTRINVTTNKQMFILPELCYVELTSAPYLPTYLPAYLPTFTKLTLTGSKC
jgi:hypothetical protein